MRLRHLQGMSTLALDQLQWRVRLMTVRRRGQRRIALASFPRSGNTWFRFLLESATGELTGVAKGHDPREARVLPRAQEGLVIKTHRRDAHRYTHAIHLVRNPFDVADSFYDWRASLGWPGKHGEETWDDFVKRIIAMWRQHTRHWLSAGTTSYLVRYEDCLKDPLNQFGSLLQWLERPVSPEALAAAIEASSFERLKQRQSAESAVGDRFFRRGTAAKGIDRFTPEQRRWVLNYLEAELEKCRYTDLLEQARA
jgi:hypothetical protein